MNEIINKIIEWIYDPATFLNNEENCKEEITTIISSHVSEQLISSNVGSQMELLIAFFMHFRDKGEQNIGMTIEDFVDDYLSNL